jgi:hypothetical protein
MKYSTLIVLIPVAVLATLFAVGNRHEVIVKLDPLAREDAALAFVMPLYLLVFITLLAGVMLGGATVALKRGVARKKRLKATEIGDAIVTLGAGKPGKESNSA